MKRLRWISALLMLLIYTTASTGSAAAALLCDHCHCHHEHIHHSEECVCHGLSFETPCDGHTHIQYVGAYADLTKDSRQTAIYSLIALAAVACGSSDAIPYPTIDVAGQSPLVDAPPLAQKHVRVSALRAPPARV